MKSKEATIPKVTRHQSDMNFTADEVNTILMHISTQIDVNNINLSERVRRYDNYERLSENDFKTCFDFRGLNLNKPEITILFNKYFNTLDDRVYVDQLLIDLGKFSSGSKANPGKNKIDEKKALVVKIARFVQKNKKEVRLVDEIFMTDRYNDGFLSEKKIMDAFHNSDVKLSSNQLYDLLDDFKPKYKDQYDYVKILVAMFGETDQIKRKRDRVKGDSKKNRYSNTIKKEEDKNEGRLGKRRGSRTSSIDSRRSNDGRSLNSRDSKSRTRARDDLDRSFDSKRSYRSDKSINSRRSYKSDVSGKGSLRNRTESRSPYGRDRTESRSPYGRDRTYTKDREESLIKRREDSNLRPNGNRSRSPSDKSLNRNRDIYTSSPEKNEYSRSYERDKPRANSSVGLRDKEGPDVGKGRSGTHYEPKKSSLKKPIEMTSMTRFVGSRIKLSKKNYIEVFKDVNNNHSSKLINDKELLKALRTLDVKLEYGDEDKLTLEIDTQGIRNNKRFFSYEKFLNKAGIYVNKNLKLQTELSIETKMTKSERKEAEDTIEEIKKELKIEKMTLYQAVDIGTSEFDIQWVSFKNGIEDHLKKYWIKLTSNKNKLAILKLYLCGHDSNTVEIEWIKKAFGIEDDRKVDTHKDNNDLFNQEDSK
jgi:hypothetical protein